jgi:membrane-associated protease RseP (regulator of RpoE activity)
LNKQVLELLFAAGVLKAEHILILNCSEVNKMLRRISLVILMIAALGAGAVIAAESQKDKAKTKESSDSKAQKEKDKTSEPAQGLFPVELLSGEAGYLGVYLEEVTPERTRELGLTEERGAIVMKVVADSPAAKSGLKENDVIVSFNGRRVDSVREMQRLLNETPAERSVQIEVIRGGGRQTVAATLSKRSFHGFGGTLGQGFDDKVFKQREGWDELKRSEDMLNWYKGRADMFPRDFGDFTFVNPGEFALFGGTRLGISAESLTDQLAEFFGVKDNKGALVASVQENSPAAKGGLKAGDVIIAVDNERVENVRGLIKALSEKKEGTIALKVVRNRSEQTVTVTLEKPETLTPRKRAIAYRQATLVV